MSAIDPTCLPWQTKHDFDIEGSTTIIGNVDGEIFDGTTHHTFDFVARTLDLEDDSQSHSVAVANAAFIVRACNSHRALVEALEKLADRTLEFVGAKDGTFDPEMECDAEMLALAEVGMRVVAHSKAGAA